MLSRYRSAFLDAGGVLVGPNWQRASAVLARHGVHVAPDVLEAAEPAVKKALDVPPDGRADDRRAARFPVL